MELTELYSVLEKAFATNFVTYYKAHMAHWNVRGRTFYQDHKLLKKIYEYLQHNIDNLAEELMACGATHAPESLSAVMSLSRVEDNMPALDSDDLLKEVLDDLYKLIDVYHEMDQAGKIFNYPDVSNMAADHIQKIAKYCWQIEATLEISGKHSPNGRTIE
jgi:starvation-inducible DNA-binding protein